MFLFSWYSQVVSFLELNRGFHFVEWNKYNKGKLVKRKGKYCALCREKRENNSNRNCFVVRRSFQFITCYVITPILQSMEKKKVVASRHLFFICFTNIFGDLTHATRFYLSLSLSLSLAKYNPMLVKYVWNTRDSGQYRPSRRVATLIETEF